jgi:hypothetical protein
MEQKIVEARQADRAEPLVNPLTFQYLDDLQAKLQPYMPRLEVGMLYDRQAKYLSWHFDPCDYPHLELLHITDTQFGHRFCNVTRLVEYRDWVLSKPYRYVLFGGDMIDAWALWSPGMPWDQEGAPDTQLYKFCEVMAPMRHRVLGYVGGNHERRAIKGFGDLGVLISNMLRIPYSNGKQLIDVHFGKHEAFKVSLWHGGGAAQTKGSIANVIHRFMLQGDSQLYLVGHLHQPLIIPDWRELRVPSENKVRLEKIVGAISSSFLETWGTYGEQKCFRPTDVMMARAVLERNGHWEVTLR